MLNKIKFLLTNRLTVWQTQERCLTDMVDCPDCGTGLWHSVSAHLSLKDALKAAVEDLESIGEMPQVTTKQVGEEWHVESDQTGMWLCIYKVTITL